MSRTEGDNGRIVESELHAASAPDLALSLLWRTRQLKGQDQTGEDPLKGQPTVAIGQRLLGTMTYQTGEEEFGRAAQHIKAARALVEEDVKRVNESKRTPLMPPEHTLPQDIGIVVVVSAYISNVADQRLPITPAADFKPWTPPPAVEIKYSPIANHTEIRERQGF